MTSLTEHPGLLYVIATLLPLVSFVLLFLGGKRWGKAGAYVATGAIGGACVLSVIGLVLFLDRTHYEHLQGHHDEHPAKPQADQHKPQAELHKPHVEKKEDHSHKGAAIEEHKEPGTPPWAGSIYWAFLSDLDESGNVKLDAPALSLRLGFYIDGLAAVMFVMISFIATLIHVFSIGYMSEELQPTVDDHQAHVTRKGRFPRFFTFMSLFCFSMLNLVLADNLFQIFISWELVGICSYLLISFYYERKSAANAANKAFITNRIGDAGFIIGLLIIWTHFGTFHFHGRNVTDLDADTGKPKVVRQPGIFEQMRGPAVDSHGDPMHGPHVGRIVRASPVEIDKTAYLKADRDPDDQGEYALLFGGHLHPPEQQAGNVLYEGDQTKMPYWLLVLAGVGIFMGCVGKSAQFPLQVWLPDAMEGPTPVSALIHAATMVAAGVYLVGRAFPLFTPEVLLIIAYTGAITLFVAATIAIVQTDIKKVLAYSTVSQLGFMMLALGIGGWVAGLFHLITHAFFKALLFLCSGSVIYGCHHEQEMTKMGGLYPKMKVTALTMLMGVLAIAGTPLFSGWYSKDAIIVQALSYGSAYPRHFLLFLLPLLTAGITAFYMFRLWFMTFTGPPRDEHVHEHAHESPRVMTVPLIILAVFSVIVAWDAFPFDFDAHGSYLGHFLQHEQPSSLDAQSGDLALKNVMFQVEHNVFLGRVGLGGVHELAGVLALLAAGIGALLAVVVYYWRYLDPAQSKEQFAGVYNLFWNKWYFDQLYSAILVRPALVVSRAARWFDTRVIDGVIDSTARGTVRLSDGGGRFDLGIIDGLVNLTANVFYGIGNWLRVFQTGLIRNYVLFLALAAVGIFAVLSYVMALTR